MTVTVRTPGQHTDLFGCALRDTSDHLDQRSVSFVGDSYSQRMLYMAALAASQSGAAADPWVHSDWINLAGVVATAFSAVIALVLGVYGVRRDRAERQDLRSRQRREQASLVVLWISDAYDGMGSKKMVVRNDSPLPIRNVRLMYSTISSREEDAGEEIETEAWTAAVAGGREATTTINYAEWDMSKKPMRVEFTDAAGVDWARYEDAQLIELEQPARP